MNEEKRNPYIPTQAPLLVDESAPSELKPDVEGVPRYGGFWRRVGAQLADFLVMSPIFVVTYFGVQYSKMFYVWSFVPSLLFALFYQVWLVRRFGGTPGKRALDMRIALQDGGAITAKAALLRYSVIGILTVIQSFALLVATRHVSDDSYYGLGYLEKAQVLTAAAPVYYTWDVVAIQLWMIAVAITMLCNRRRRTLHDFIAGTVVLHERR